MPKKWARPGKLLTFAFFVKRQEFIQLALKAAKTFFHFVDALYGVFHLTV